MNGPVAALPPRFPADLAESWRDLADYVGIRPHDQYGFTAGPEPRAIWGWLSARDRLGDLPAALTAIGREDLARVFRAGTPAAGPGSPPRVGDLRLAAGPEGSALITDRAEGFTGRRDVLAQLTAVLADPRFRSGYAVVSGEPGIGKTALLAALVRRDGLTHHFAGGPAATTGSPGFLRNVCAQLVRAGRLPADQLPGGEMTDGLLLRLLGEVAREQRLVVAVDAVDEGPAPRLTLPPALPPGVFFAVTARDPGDPVLCVDERRDVVLAAADPGNVSDAAEYVATFLARHAGPMASQLAALHLSTGSFARLLTERAAGNFLYLRHVLHAVCDGGLGAPAPAAPTALPRGLRDYYAWLPGQLARLGGDPARQLATLAVLAVWPEPLAAARLAAFAGESLEHTHETLRWWARFVSHRRCDGESRVTLYHASFRDFLGDVVDLAAVRTRIEAAIEGDSR